MLRKSSLSSFDINSSASYTEKSISWSSWSTSLTIPDEDDQQMIVDDHRTIEADYQHPNRQRLRSLSMDEKKLHRKSSFIGSKTDFGDCEDRGVASNLLEDIIQCSTKDRKQKILIFSSSYPYHIEWANSEWSKISGWSSDEISGLDCHFLYGDATDKTEVTKFWSDLWASDGYASLDILNYNKLNTLHHNTIHCFPVIDNCGPQDALQVSHIAVVLTESYEVHHSSVCSELIEDLELEEVGMPLDRREGCSVYPHQNELPPPPLSNWLTLTDNLPLALMLRYMLRSQAPLVLIDSEERIVHVNVGWVNLTGFSAIDCEGKLFSSFFDTVRDICAEAGYAQFQSLIARVESQRVSEIANKSSIPIRDAHAPSSYEVANVFLTKKSRTIPNQSSSLSAHSFELPSPSSPDGIASLFPSAFGSPALSRSWSLSSDGNDNSGKDLKPTNISLGIPIRLSPVPIGSKHIAILCVPSFHNGRNYSI